MPKRPDPLELRKAIHKAKRNRDRAAFRAKDLFEQGKLDEAQKFLERADHWEAERKKLESTARTPRAR